MRDSGRVVAGGSEYVRSVTDRGVQDVLQATG